MLSFAVLGAPSGHFRQALCKMWKVPRNPSDYIIQHVIQTCLFAVFRSTLLAVLDPLASLALKHREGWIKQLASLKETQARSRGSGGDDCAAQMPTPAQAEDSFSASNKMASSLPPGNDAAPGLEGSKVIQQPQSDRLSRMNWACREKRLSF